MSPPTSQSHTIDVDMDQTLERAAFNNRTNRYDDEELPKYPSQKRQAPEDHKPPRKRAKLVSTNEPINELAESKESDDDDDVVSLSDVSPRCWSIFALRNKAMTFAPFASSRLPHASTHSLLRSFVSSNKSDVYKCHSIEMDSDITLPYACSYSHQSKRGGKPLLALSTEQGTVLIVNTEKRNEWDAEPQRTVLRPYGNGIFDVQWSPSDTQIATASAGSSIQISSLDASVSDVETTRILQGHCGTVKCVAWDPKTDGSMLCSGGRDGAICLWDLRQESDTPVMTILDAHEDTKTPRPRARKGKLPPAAPQRSVTSVLYTECNPYGVTSAGSLDGILRHWDFRLPRRPGRKPRIQPTHYSPLDPTLYQGAHRARGITSLTPGSGPTAGLLFALGHDSRIHTYNMSSLAPLSGNTANTEDDTYSYSHPNMRNTSFYVRTSLSPCGRWLASGGADNGSVYLFDVSNAGRVQAGPGVGVVELRGQKGEVGAVDWAENMVASCADDGTVRVWRPDISTYRQCQEDPEDMKWNWCWAIDDA